MRNAWLLPVLGIALLSGCVGPDDDTKTVDDAVATPIYHDDRITIEGLSGGNATETPSLDAPAEWRRGEWWTVELTDFFVGRTYTATRVVAGSEGSDFLVGMPTHDFSNDFMVLHIPGFGQVAKADNSFEIHDCRYHPLQFPLKVGDTWETEFECRDVVAEVVAVDGLRATVHLLGNQDNITLVYDAAQRQIVEWTKDNYGSYKVVAHGYDWDLAFPAMDGLVTVPHMHDVIFQHGRIGGALWSADTPVGLGPYAPTDTVFVESTYDRVSFVLILGNLWGIAGLPADPPAGGYYKETAEAPDGTTYALEKLPADGSAFSISTHKHDAPGGDWEFTHLAAGPGLAMAEGIAYHVYDVEIATGRILPSVGEHQHGTDDGH